MNSITMLTPGQLRHAADLQERIQSLQGELSQLLGGQAQPVARRGRPPGSGRGGRKRRLSAQGLANIRAGVAKRMAARAGAQGNHRPRRRKRNFTPEGRARLSALANARWAKARREGKSRL